jgi:hypothetical protein
MAEENTPTTEEIEDFEGYVRGIFASEMEKARGEERDIWVGLFEDQFGKIQEYFQESGGGGNSFNEDSFFEKLGNFFEEQKSTFLSPKPTRTRQTTVRTTASVTPTAPEPVNAPKIGVLSKFLGFS